MKAIETLKVKEGSTGTEDELKKILGENDIFGNSALEKLSSKFSEQYFKTTKIYYSIA